MNNRKAAEEFLIKEMTTITPNGGNGVIYKNLLSKMSDKEFEEFVTHLENGGDLAIWLSNSDRKDDIDFDDVVKRCEELGYPVYQRIVTYDIDTGLKTMTSHPQFVGTAELMKQSQMWAKKVSYAANDNHVEDLTGQVMGDSRATGFSMPEIHVLGLALGLPNTVDELYNVKGGDTSALKAYRNDLIETGGTTINSCLKRGDIAKSLKTLHYWMNARLLENNLDVRNG